MASLGYGGAELAEAYTMRKMYKEKLKKMEEEEGQAFKGNLPSEADKGKKSSPVGRGRSFWGFKKRNHHATSKVSSASS